MNLRNVIDLAVLAVLFAVLSYSAVAYFLVAG